MFILIYEKDISPDAGAFEIIGVYSTAEKAERATDFYVQNYMKSEQKQIRHDCRVLEMELDEFKVRL